MNSLEEFQRHRIALLILSGKKLTQLEREKAAEWIVGKPIKHSPKQVKKRGRPPKSIEAETFAIIELYREIRPRHKTDSDAFREIHASLRLRAKNGSKDFEDCKSRIWHAINDNKQAVEEIEKSYWERFDEVSKWVNERQRSRKKSAEGNIEEN
ncbi:hypothetical protein KI811_06980 [Geobacter hydrogenophilus]|uniref:hypothetical protein n=1 Tax=Geobacter hydrogenophilus TaxID=40983 RepID=UPI001BDA5A5B|nr:hypothetical protein [Geobacter hydrogenophilus]MBT0893551.1 hypothetical protein [Geobacter hydrogenophilus]